VCVLYGNALPANLMLIQLRLQLTNLPCVERARLPDELWASERSRSFSNVCVCNMGVRVVTRLMRSPPRQQQARLALQGYGAGSPIKWGGGCVGAGYNLNIIERRACSFRRAAATSSRPRPQAISTLSPGRALSALGKIKFLAAVGSPKSDSAVVCGGERGLQQTARQHRRRHNNADYNNKVH
jgi:hypothetical protein